MKMTHEDYINTLKGIYDNAPRFLTDVRETMKYALDVLSNAEEVEVFNDWQYGKDPDRTPQPAIKLRNMDWKIGEKKIVFVIPKKDDSNNH